MGNEGLPQWDGRKIRFEPRVVVFWDHEDPKSIPEEIIARGPIQGERTIIVTGSEI